MAICLDYQSVYCDRTRSTASLKFQIFAASMLLFALALKVWVKIERTDLGYDLAREKERTVQLDMKRRELELQLSVLTRPDTLTKEASKQLGLQAFDSKRARRIKLD
ncbi:MAG: hypothetical protein K1X83_11565 [Oligoflexia bacterium]|nr:hypothetical protein [Oligoflexia bacterium]